jgi:hypothetical protein
MRFHAGYRFQVRMNLAYGMFDLLAGRVMPDGSLEAITNCTVQTLPPGSSHPGRFMQLDEGEAQLLLDELWRAGVRPTDQRDHGTTGHVKALEKHAEVMEAIACGLLRRDGVEL